MSKRSSKAKVEAVKKSECDLLHRSGAFNVPEVVIQSMPDELSEVLEGFIPTYTVYDAQNKAYHMQGVHPVFELAEQSYKLNQYALQKTEEGKLQFVRVG